MNNIYKYIHEDFETSNVIEKINRINDELEQELSKDKNLRDKEKEFKLINQQFMEGLKLSTRGNRMW